MSLMGAMNQVKATSNFLDIDMNDLSDKANIGFTRSGQGAMSHAVKVSINRKKLWIRIFFFFFF